MKTLKLRKADCKEILKLTFPNYKGRKYNLSLRQNYYISDSYWNGGSRTYTKLVNFNDNKIKELPEMKWEGKEFEITDNMLIVTHNYFCGHDCGITIICSPNSNFIKDKNLIG